MDADLIRRLRSAAKCRVPSKDKRVKRSEHDHPQRVQAIEAKLMELQSRQAA